MLIQKHTEHSGVDIHLDPDECDLFVRLSIDAETAALEGNHHAATTDDGDGPASYFTLSVALGRRIRALHGSRSVR